MSTQTFSEIVVWLLLAALLGGALGWTLSTLWHRRAPRSTPAVEVAPIAQDPVAQAAAPEVEPPAVPARPGPYPRSVLPGPDDSAPGPEWVVKAKISSMICHAPGSPAYARTRADVWFRDEADALAAGFRTPKTG